MLRKINAMYRVAKEQSLFGLFSVLKVPAEFTEGPVRKVKSETLALHVTFGYGSLYKVYNLCVGL